MSSSKLTHLSQSRRESHHGGEQQSHIHPQKNCGEILKKKEKNPQMSQTEEKGSPEGSLRIMSRPGVQKRWRKGGARNPSQIRKAPEQLHIHRESSPGEPKRRATRSSSRMNRGSGGEGSSDRSQKVCKSAGPGAVSVSLISPPALWMMLLPLLPLSI